MDKILNLLFFALDRADRQLADHCRRIAALSGRLARHVSDDPAFVKSVYIAGMLHDIGFLKLHIDFSEKPISHMTPEEHKTVALHSIEGEKLIRTITNNETILKAILYHHELYNGKGYPEGLSGTEIPLAARLLSTVDFYDALLVGEMFGEQAHKPATVRDSIRTQAGNMLDPTLSELLLQLLDRNVVYYAPDGLDETLIYKLVSLEPGPLKQGNLLSHDGTILVHQGVMMDEHILNKIKDEFPGHKLIVPDTHPEM